METLDFIQFGGWVKRYHGVPTLNTQTNAEHLFGQLHLVAMMALDAEPGDGEGLTVPLMMATICSDLPEWVTGDMPAPGKRSFPWPVLVAEENLNGERRATLREAWNMRDATLLETHGLNWEHNLGPLQLRWLKLADAMEGCLFCIKERMQGNKYIGPRCYTHFRQYIRDVLNGTDPAPMEARIINYIDDMWEQADG